MHISDHQMEPYSFRRSDYKVDRLCKDFENCTGLPDCNVVLSVDVVARFCDSFTDVYDRVARFCAFDEHLQKNIYWVAKMVALADYL